MPKEPYRKLFALGLVSGYAGVGLWLAASWGWIVYPILPHTHIMVFGFFLSFVSGFLMTALPRMSASWPANQTEIWTAVGIIGSGVLFALFGRLGAAFTMAALQFVFLLQFGLRRFFYRKKNPPAGFMFVPVGLAWAFLSATVYALIASGNSVSPELQSLARIGLQEGFLLNLIVGIGGRLIPFITRVPAPEPTQAVSENFIRPMIILVLLNVSLLGEATSYFQAAWALRALVLGFAAVMMFKILKERSESTLTGSALRLSIVAMVFSYAALAIYPEYRLALLHVVFIAGYTVLTLMIATRVTLAHGLGSLELEKKSIVVAFAVLCLFIAAALRAFYLLPWAAAFWLAGAMLWGYRIGRYLR